jgi:uncharacterized protein YqhQ
VAIFHPNWFWLVASRVLAIPLIAGAGFEAIRFMARHRTNPVIKILLLPVLGTQKFTTREPTDDMMEVAITAFNSAREGEEEEAQVGRPSRDVVAGTPKDGNPPANRAAVL